MSCIGFIELSDNYKESSGVFRHRIKWIPPKEDGFIVQYVELEDPLRIIHNYTKPYYEAWIVEKGKTKYEDYDDEFNNDGDGTFRLEMIDVVQERLKKTGEKNSVICYKCRVYWVPKGTPSYDEVDKWEPLKENMSADLPCSFDFSYLGEIDLKREYRVRIELQQ